ncbi:hypothetical protein INR49_014290 [Caranx melampygus]|nr:hypothetical protein INR49_014290 [Caranx melampygus]
MEVELKLDSQFMNRSAENKPSIVQNRPTIQKNTHLLNVAVLMKRKSVRLPWTVHKVQRRVVCRD